MHLNELKDKKPQELLDYAESLGIENASGLKKQEIYFSVLKKFAEKNEEIIGEGVLETMQDGFGFLRSADSNYLPGPDDIYVSPNQIKKYGLRKGDTLEGPIRPPKDGERYFALVEINKVNFIDISKNNKFKTNFDNLTPLYPEKKFNLETDKPDTDLSSRIIDIIAPVGAGQRSLIVAPPRSGKTVILQKIAKSIAENFPNVYLMVLLIDERPEEVTDM